MTWERPAKLCVRCGGYWRFGINWPDGYVCRSCISRAVKVRDVCPGCGDERLLAGRDGDGRAICVDCAGIKTNFWCRRCGREDSMWYSQTCPGCALEIRLRLALGDGRGRVVPDLVPLFDRIRATANPTSVLNWIGKPAVRQRLRSLADGSVELTHAGIDTMRAGQGREFLRELLVEVGVLPQRDKYLAAFERWQSECLAAIAEPAIRREIKLYLAWRQARILSVRADAGRLSASHTNRARDLTGAAVRFLRFLAERGLVLAELSQDDVDAWFAEGPNPHSAEDFLSFAIEHRRCPRVAFARRRATSSAGSPLSQFNEIIGRLISDDSIDLSDRVAGLFVLLFAQPVSRVAEMRVAQVEPSARSVAFGPDPMPLPEPVAALVCRYLGRRSRMNTTNTATDFLFPGGRPGEPVTAFQLTKRLNRFGITKRERQGALSHLVSEVPAPVVARATGYSIGTTAARSVLAGNDWARYAAIKSRGMR